MRGSGHIVDRVEGIYNDDGVVVLVHLQRVWTVRDFLIWMERSDVYSHIVKICIEIEKLDEEHSKIGRLDLKRIGISGFCRHNLVLA